MKGRGPYTREFKLEAVRLLQRGEKPAAQLAMELGVKRSLLYRWRKLAAFAFLEGGGGVPLTGWQNRYTLPIDMARSKNS